MRISSRSFLTLCSSSLRDQFCMESSSIYPFCASSRVCISFISSLDFFLSSSTLPFRELSVSLVFFSRSPLSIFLKFSWTASAFSVFSITSCPQIFLSSSRIRRLFCRIIYRRKRSWLMTARFGRFRALPLSEDMDQISLVIYSSCWLYYLCYFRSLQSRMNSRLILFCELKQLSRAYCIYYEIYAYISRIQIINAGRQDQLIANGIISLMHVIFYQCYSYMQPNPIFAIIPPQPLQPQLPSLTTTPSNRQTSTSIVSTTPPPTLSKYRIFRFTQRGSSLSETCMCRLSTSKKRHCTCQAKSDQCVMALNWMKMIYEPKEHPRLKGLYDNYEKKSKKEFAVLEAEVARDVAEVTAQWGIAEVKEELLKMLLNFSMHCTYYRRTVYLKIYTYLGAAILYHCQPYQAFWILDTITEQMQFLTKTPGYIQSVYTLLTQYLKQKVTSIQRQDVDLKSVIAYLMQDLLCSYTQIEFMGYNIESLLINGWKHVQQLMLSYLDKRIEAMEKAGTEGRDLIYIGLLNNDTQWPLIFFNIESFNRLE